MLRTIKNNCQTSLILLLFPLMVFASEPAEDALWQKTLISLEAGNALESTRLLRLCLLGSVNLPETEKLLRNFLASESAGIVNSREFSELPEKDLQRILLLQNEICDFKSSSAEDWRYCLRIAQTLKDNRQFVVVGEALLNRIRAGLPINVDEEWIFLLKKLEGLLLKQTQVLYRLQICEILAQIDITASEYAAKCENMRILARTNAAKIIEQAEVAMALGDLDAARRHIHLVENFDPAYPGLERAGQKLVKATELHRLTGLIALAMRERRFNDAGGLCAEMQKLDANNIYARGVLQQISDMKKDRPGRAESAESRIKIAIRRLESELHKAEHEQDILRVRDLLKELLLLKNDSTTWHRRLAEVENQIALSHLNAEESFKTAQQLAKENRYDDLRLFLNRNPGLMSSLETMLQAWEMRLMCNYYAGKLTTGELREAAENLLARSGKSFYASFVLMKLAIANNKFTEAEMQYRDAIKLNPSYPGLRWPGWLLWMHGDGRPVAVVMLIVVFFLMIQLLRPTFALYESTYWFRIGLLAKVFPSLALRSLEKCFGLYRDTEDRIRLFRLLVFCSNAIGN
ncbi:MAG: hypothetical protein EOM80_14725, partial [Erysipelotrichia bacterium]|nr:hypothetical protein [Erysipelotrichia bacterium]